MPRTARIILPGSIYHITQRGNNKKRIFYTDRDRKIYLILLQEACEKYGTKIIAYCLMNNHVHFIAVPVYEDSFARTFSLAHMRYAQHMNKEINQIGHLWQSRYHSSYLNEGHLYMAVKYVERNPVRAGLVKHAWEWPWSSARAHLGMETPAIPLDDIYEYLDIDYWRNYLLEDEEGTVPGDSPP